jgi:thiamine biosynthesis lipoprotein
MEYYEFRAMNSDIVLAAEGSRAAEGFEATRAFVEACEKRFTRFTDTSELARLNRSAGNWFAASPEMFDVLETALGCYLKTDGLFAPSILPNLKEIGYTHSMDELRRDGAPAASSKTAIIPFSEIELQRESFSVRLPLGMQIDLGGIAKGWIAERGAHLLAEYSPACAVSAGGDMFFLGHPLGQTGWEVGLEDPRNPSEDITLLWVDKGAVATSSVAKRVWRQGDQTRHHLIDPRTGLPAETPWLSVTVFAPQAAVAEAFAKAILIGGPTIASALIEKNPDLICLAVDQKGALQVLSQEKESVHGA